MLEPKVLRYGTLSTLKRAATLQVVPGSFNPLHDGHWWLYNNTQASDDRYFEISKSRVGKEALSDEDIAKRVDQFKNRAKVLVTEAPLFSDKYDTLRNFAEEIVFHIGMDTYERLVQMSGILGVEAMRCAIFMVYDRSGVTLPRDKPSNCFVGAPSPVHLQNISSTHIRTGKMNTAGTLL